MRVPLLLNLFWKAIQAWQADKAPQLGAALAYYTLFAIAPVLLVVIAIAGAVFGEEAVRGEIVGQIDGLIGEQGARAVQALLQGAYRPGRGRFAALAGSLTFIVAASGAFLALQGTLNTIWRVKARPTKGINLRQFLARRLRSFALVISIGFLLMVSLTVSAALAALGSWLERTAPAARDILTVVNAIVSLGVITVLFTLLFQVLPDVRLRWRDVLIGGFATAALFTAGKFLIGLYLGHSNVSSSYGAIGSVLVLLVWVYYSAQIVLLGAEFTRIWTERNRDRPQVESFAQREPEPSRIAAQGADGSG
jgi:membrane protein